MRTIVQGPDKVVCFDEQVWKQERNVIRFTHDNTEEVAKTVSMWTDLHGSTTNPLATYTLDNDGKVTIDMTDYIRTYPSVSWVRVECEIDYTILIPLRVVGLINPESVIVPSDKAREVYNATFGTSFNSVVVPPSRMVKSIAEGILIRGEFWPTDGETVTGAYYISESAEGVDIRIAERVVEFAYGQEKWQAFNDERSDDVVQSGTITPLECGHRYAAVRWVSFSGQTRCHTWEVVKAESATRDEIALLTVDGSYRKAKGREDGFVLALDGLSAYDYWYYSDIIFSSKVEVSLDGVNWQQVEVTTKDSTTPDGDAGLFNKLEVQVNYKKYDSTTM